MGCKNMHKQNIGNLFSAFFNFFSTTLIKNGTLTASRFYIVNIRLFLHQALNKLLRTMADFYHVYTCSQRLKRDSSSYCAYLSEF